MHNEIIFRKGFGTRGSECGQLDHPTGIMVDPGTKNIFICDWNNHRIQIFSRGGRFLKSFGSRGSGNDEFFHPFSICLFDREIFITDSFNNRIQVFSLESPQAYIRSIPLPKVNPRFIACSKEGDLIVDNKNSLIILDRHGGGVEIKRFGGPGKRNGEFGCVRGITVNSRNQILWSTVLITEYKYLIEVEIFYGYLKRVRLIDRLEFV